MKIFFLRVSEDIYYTIRSSPIHSKKHVKPLLSKGCLFISNLSPKFQGLLDLLVGRDGMGWDEMGSDNTSTIIIHILCWMRSGVDIT